MRLKVVLENWYPLSRAQVPALPLNIDGADNPFILVTVSC
jgi:hypothetical protein